MTTDKTKTEKLAREFAKLMRRDLTAAQMKKANALNAKDSKDVCHTHDFIDANMTMAEAFERVVGHSPEVHQEDEASRADVALWNSAWDIAKAARFFVIDKHFYLSSSENVAHLSSENKSYTRCGKVQRARMTKNQIKYATRCAPCELAQNRITVLRTGGR